MSFIRVSLRGTLPGGESWSVNPAYRENFDVTTWSQTEGQAAATAIGALTVPADLKTLQGAAAPFSQVRVERRSDANELLGAAEAAWTGGGQPTQSSSKPYQSATVISLRSNVPGASGRGRLYWPAIGSTLSTTTLRLATPTTTAVATAAKTYLDAIETALKEAFHPSPDITDVRLAVYSPTRRSCTDIVRIEVGDILDTQRRRRDAVVEAYASVAY